MNDEKRTVTALVVILHNPQALPRLLRAWERIGVPGTTILPSMGGYQAQRQAQRSGLGSLLDIFTNADEPGQRTIISLIDDPATLEQAIAEADRVVKGFDSPRSGILFTFPLHDVLGLQKWRQAPPPEQPEEKKSAAKESNLLKWFQEDLKQAYGRQALQDWSRQRGLQIAQVIRRLDLDPIIVRVDTPLEQILSAFEQNPTVHVAAVVNTEGRLMGIIPLAVLSDVLMAPIVPEAYIESAEGYNMALQYAQPGQEIVAADIMGEPVYAHLNATLQETFQRMREHHLPGLPVVNAQYEVKGYVTLLEMLSACFSTAD